MWTFTKANSLHERFKGDKKDKSKAIKGLL